MNDKELLAVITPALKGIGKLPIATDTPTNPETGELAAAFIKVLQTPRVYVVDEGTKRLMSEISPVIAKIKHLDN